MGSTASKAELERQLEDERAERARAAETGEQHETDDEPTDDENDEQHETDDEPTDDEPASEKTAEQLGEELGLLMEGFEGALRELFGVDEPLVEIPMQGALGFMLPGSLDYRTNDKYTRCETCNGHGVVITGSIADGKQTADCPRCAGLGYLTRLEGEQPVDAAPTNGSADAAADAQAGYGVEKWMGDPSLGGP